MKEEREPCKSRLAKTSLTYYKWGNWGLERGHNLVNVTELLMARPGSGHLEPGLWTTMLNRLSQHAEGAREGVTGATPDAGCGQSGQTHELGVPWAKVNPTEQAEMIVIDRAWEFLLIRNTLGQGSVLCVSTHAPGDTKARSGVRTTELGHLEGVGVDALQPPIQAPPRPLGLEVSGRLSFLVGVSVHPTRVITSWQKGGRSGRLEPKSASVLKTMILRPEALLQRDILSECDGVGLLDPSEGVAEWAQVASLTASFPAPLSQSAGFQQNLKHIKCRDHGRMSLFLALGSWGVTRSAPPWSSTGSPDALLQPRGHPALLRMCWARSSLGTVAPALLSA